MKSIRVIDSHTGGEAWVQEGILGSRFRAHYRRAGENIVAVISGTAFVTAEATLLLNPEDPLCWGIRR